MDFASAQARAAPDFIAVGIDFGTTFSAISLSDGNRPMAVSRWPAGFEGQHCLHDENEVPTQVGLYDGRRGGVRWGYQVAPDEEAFRWFKLALVHPEYLSRTIQESAAMENAQQLRRFHGMSPSELTTDYLRALWTTGLQEAAKRYHTTIDQLVQATFHVVVGTPANWSPDTLCRLREAVANAGIPGHYSPQSTVSFLLEPEAATLSLLERRAISAGLNIGDIIVVCDCGGGTADAISYEILSTAPLTVHECVPGDSRLAGPVLMDEEFMRLAEQKIRARTTAAMEGAITRPKLRAFLEHMWETDIKRSFDVSPVPQSREVPFSFMTTAERRRRLGASAPEVIFTGEEIKQLFDPSVDEIVGLVKSQVDAVASDKNKLPKAVILCGGFSGSPYLQSMISREINAWNKAYKDCWGFDGATRLEHGEGDQGALAVSHGCLLHALGQRSGHSAVRVASRIARARYSFGAINGSGIDCDASSLRLVERGDTLPVNDSRRIPVDMVKVANRTLLGGGICLVIYQDSNSSAGRERRTKYCEIVWTEEGAPALVTAVRAGRLVEVAVSSVDSNVFFDVYVDSVLQERGRHVIIRSEMLGA